MLIIFLFNSILSLGYFLKLPICHNNDFHYVFTECDKNNFRWKVSVPKNDNCNGGMSDFPQKIKCISQCDSGYYLNDENGNCTPCPAGTFSKGNIIEYSNWTLLPPNFKISSETFGSRGEAADNQFNTYNSDINNCSNSIWQPQGSYISSNPNLCIASLIIKFKLTQPGKLKFSYQYADLNTFFNYMVVNELCEESNKKLIKWPEITSEMEWKTETILLKSGQNIIIWRTAGIAEALIYDSIKINKVIIQGVPYVSNCNSCSPGTFSSKGSSVCQPCPANSFSLGSNSCSPCNLDEYSDVGSYECFKRKPCTLRDMKKIYSECDVVSKKRNSKYEWIKPKLCLETLPNSIQLPEDKLDSNFCIPCPPGMYLQAPISSNISSTKLKNKFPNAEKPFGTIDNCKICPEGTFADGNEFTTNCQNCPLGTKPITGFYFNKWFNLPKYFSTTCISDKGECPSLNYQWYFNGDYTSPHNQPDPVINERNKSSRRRIKHSSKSVAFNYYVLSLNAFVKPLDASTTVSFQFQFVRPDNLNTFGNLGEGGTPGKCSLYFVKVDSNKRAEIIREWFTTPDNDGNLKDHVTTFHYNLAVSHPSPSTIYNTFKLGAQEPLDKSSFRWIFQAPQTNAHVCNINIYNINVTNAELSPFRRRKGNITETTSWIRGGATHCRPCTIINHNQSKNSVQTTLMDCLPCPYGSYLDSKLVNATRKINQTSTTIYCRYCPTDTVLNALSYSTNLESGGIRNVENSICKPCPFGTISTPGDFKCYSNCSLKLIINESLKHYEIPSGTSTHNFIITKVIDKIKAIQKPIEPRNSSHQELNLESYDFSQLSGIHFAVSEPLFTSGGSGYQYLFAFQICKQPLGSATPSSALAATRNESISMLDYCLDSELSDIVKNSKPIISPQINTNHSISGLDIDINNIAPFVCRTIMFPKDLNVSNIDKIPPKLDVAAAHYLAQKRMLPVSLGDEIVGIGTLDSSSTLKRLIQNRYDRLLTLDSQNMKTNFNPADIQILYRTNVSTMACPNGRYTLVTISCDTVTLSSHYYQFRPLPFNNFLRSPLRDIKYTKTTSSLPRDPNKSNIYLPTDCKLGTCDGCNFRINWLTVHACPICNILRDVDVMPGECTKGKQAFYYYPKRFCKPPNDTFFSEMLYRSCTILSFKMRMLILIIAFSILVLMLTLFFLWKRNRKLEYKYMALVRHQSTKKRFPINGGNGKGKQRKYRKVEALNKNVIGEVGDHKGLVKSITNNNFEMEDDNIPSSEDEDIFITNAETCAIHDGDTSDEYDINNNNKSGASKRKLPRFKSSITKPRTNELLENKNINGLSDTNTITDQRLDHPLGDDYSEDDLCLGDNNTLIGKKRNYGNNGFLSNYQPLKNLLKINFKPIQYFTGDKENASSVPSTFLKANIKKLLKRSNTTNSITFSNDNFEETISLTPKSELANHNWSDLKEKCSNEPINVKPLNFSGSSTFQNITLEACSKKGDTPIGGGGDIEHKLPIESLNLIDINNNA